MKHTCRNKGLNPDGTRNYDLSCRVCIAQQGMYEGIGDDPLSMTWWEQKPRHIPNLDEYDGVFD